MASEPSPTTSTSDLCECEWCKGNRDVEVPVAVHRACERGDLVFFAGAGVSTEQQLVLPHRLVDQVIEELDLDPFREWTFPEVMTKYEETYGRPELLQRIKKHLDFVKSFPNLDGEAGRFHRELASLYTVTEIFTTNWDTYFEENCGAQPFVSEEDWALWKAGARSVFKLHGSISNPGSIVATESDYEDCYHVLNEGLNGARLKQMLATKTVVFVGYSLRDKDFVRLYEALRAKMGKLMPKAYVVTLDDGEPVEIARHMTIIRTSGAHFIHLLKAKFNSDELLSDERFDVLPLMRELVRHQHHELIDKGEMREDPAMFICACFQDGLMDAFDHQMANAKKGNYFHQCYTEGMIDYYGRLYDSRVEMGRYETAAYIDGYINGMDFLLATDEERKDLPLFYVAGYDGEKPLRTYDDYAAAATNFEKWEPKVYEYAKARASTLAPGVVFHHAPVL